jgi:hypothetical protein
MRGRMVFILGAGASKPYGYPTALELVEQIAFDDVNDASPLKGNKTFDALKVNLATSKARSVDVFLGRDTQKRFRQVGTWAIAEKLINCERLVDVFGRSLPARDPFPRVPTPPPKDDWYAYLLNTLTEHIKKIEDVGKLPVSFVTFNYDRSLEFFLRHYLQSNFPDNTPLEVYEVIKQIEILHVYGRLDTLSWEADDGRPYDQRITPDILNKAACDIRLLHEGEEDEKTKKVLKRAQKLMQKADAILFLGFGYHPENMRRLKVPFNRLGAHSNADKIKGIGQIWGTFYGMTGPETRAVLSEYSPEANMEAGHINHKITEALRNNETFLNMVR